MTQILRGAPYFLDSLKDKEEVNNISLYRKYNRLEEGTLRRGDTAANAPLYSTSGEMISDGLLSFFSQSEKPLILVAGSIT